MAVRSSEMTAKSLLKALIAIKHHYDRKHMKETGNIPEYKHGKQSVKDLIGQGQGVERVDLAKEGIKDFHKIAKKYGLDYAIVKDKTVEPPVYNIFFKAKDAEGINKVVAAYTAKLLKKQERKASVLEKLSLAKEKAKELGKKVVEKHKEAVR